MKHADPGISVKTMALAAGCVVACGSSGAGGGDAGRAGALESGIPDGPAVVSEGGDDGSGVAAGPDGGTGLGDGAGAGDAPGLAEASTVIGDPTGVTAVSATEFLGSIGACTHVGQGVDAPAPSAVALSYAGIRNVRDDGNPAHVADWIAMHQSSGVRVCLLTNQNVTATVDMAKQLSAAGALLAVEGPNEPNNFPVTYQGQTSGYTTTFLPVAHLQTDLYAAVKAEATLGGIPVFHSSEAGGSEPDDVGLQFLTIPAGASIAMPDGTKYADYANTHNYVCGHSSTLSDNIAWNASDPTLNVDWDGPYVEYGHTWHGGFAGYSDADLVTLPKVTTETGWVTSGTGAITQEQQGRLLMNLYLSAFKRGWAYTFVYMLRDDTSQGYWGLFDTSYQPKKSGLYLHNLTTVLGDTGDRAPGKLDYVIAGEPATVHDLLLQKASGTFELVVWDERPTGGSDDVTVNLTSTRASVRVYDPTTSTSPTQTLQNVTSVPLTLGDHPLVIEL